MVVTQVELDQLPEGTHVHGEAAELVPTQIHHLVRWHLPEVSDQVALAAVRGDEGHQGPDGVPHAEGGGTEGPSPDSLRGSPRGGGLPRAPFSSRPL